MDEAEVEAGWRGGRGRASGCRQRRAAAADVAGRADRRTAQSGQERGQRQRCEEGNRQHERGRTVGRPTKNNLRPQRGRDRGTGGVWRRRGSTAGTRGRGRGEDGCGGGAGPRLPDSTAFVPLFGETTGGQTDKGPGVFSSNTSCLRTPAQKKRRCHTRQSCAAAMHAQQVVLRANSMRRASCACVAPRAWHAYAPAVLVRLCVHFSLLHAGHHNACRAGCYSATPAQSASPCFKRMSQWRLGAWGKPGL